MIHIGKNWGNKSGKGKFWKRQLSKASRKAAKARLRGRRCNRRLAQLHSEVNYRAT